MIDPVQISLITNDESQPGNALSVEEFNNHYLMLIQKRICKSMMDSINLALTDTLLENISGIVDEAIWMY